MIKRIGFSLAIISAIAIGPVAVTTAGASSSGSDAPQSGSVIVRVGSYNASTQDSACDFGSANNSTTFAAIQDAVNYEETQTTPAPIYVCAGTYNENVVINNSGLPGFVSGSNIELDGAQWDTNGSSQGSSYETVLNGNITYLPGKTELVNEDVLGFQLQDSPLGPEIWAPNSGSGWDFSDNIIDTATGGIYFNTDGDTTDLHQSQITDNEFIQSGSVGGFAGTAIDFGGGQPADNVFIGYNDFNDLYGALGDINTTGSGGCSTPTDTNTSTQVSIWYNTYEQNPPLTGDVGNNFVNLVCTTDAEIIQNQISVTDATDTSADSPIYLGGGDVDPTIESNTETGIGGGVWWTPGIEVTTSAYDVDSAYITSNTISGFEEGVYVYGGNNANTAPTDFYILDNGISGGIDGVAIVDIEGAPSGGTVSGNTISGNKLYDCVDATSGSGTSGTANTWSLNDATTSNQISAIAICAENIVTPTNSAPSPAVVGGDYVPTATATSGDTVQISLGPASTGCTLNGATVDFSGSGTCVIDYYDPGSGIYGPAYGPPQSFAIGNGGSGGGGSGAAPASSVQDVLGFDSEGGSAEATITGANGTSVTLPTPTLTGYTFLGWFTSASGGTLVTSPYVLSAPSTTLYAQWESNSATPASQAFHLAFTIHTFVFGSSALTTQIKTEINHLVVLFNAHGVVHATLRGNATLPNNAYNQNLAKARALAVAAYMKSLGIHASLTISSSVSGATYNFAYLVVYVTTP